MTAALLLIALTSAAHATTQYPTAAALAELAAAKAFAKKFMDKVKPEYDTRLGEYRYARDYRVGDVSGGTIMQAAGSTVSGAAGTEGSLSQGDTQKVSRPQMGGDAGSGPGAYNNPGGANWGTQNSAGGMEARSMVGGAEGQNTIGLQHREDALRAPASGSGSSSAAAGGAPGAGKGGAGESAMAASSRGSAYANLSQDERPEIFRSLDKRKRLGPDEAAALVKELDGLTTKQALAKLQGNKLLRDSLREMLDEDDDADPSKGHDWYRRFLASVDESMAGVNDSGLTLFEVVHLKYREKAYRMRGARR